MSINLPCNTFIVAVIALTILKTRNKLYGEFLRGEYVAKRDEARKLGAEHRLCTDYKKGAEVRKLM